MSKEKFEPIAAQTMYGPTGSIGVTQEVVDYGVALRAGIGSFDYRPPEMSPPIDVAFIASGEEIPPLLKYHHDEFLRRPGKARRWPLVVTVLTDNEETLSPAMLEPKGQREMLGSLVEELRESVEGTVRAGVEGQLKERKVTLGGRVILGAVALVGAALVDSKLATMYGREAFSTQAVHWASIAGWYVLAGASVWSLMGIIHEANNKEARDEKIRDKTRSVMNALRNAIVPPSTLERED